MMLCGGQHEGSQVRGLVAAVAGGAGTRKQSLLCTMLLWGAGEVGTKLGFLCLTTVPEEGAAVLECRGSQSSQATSNLMRAGKPATRERAPSCALEAKQELTC